MSVSICRCRPADGFHQYGCVASQRMRADLIEAGKPKRAPDPTKCARVAWQDPGTDDVPSCGWFRHDWDEGHNPSGGCDGYTMRYTCRTCGKIKDRGGA